MSVYREIFHFKKRRISKKKKSKAHLEDFTTIQGWPQSLPDDPQIELTPLPELDPALAQMPGAPWIYKAVDTKEGTPRRFWFVVLPMGVVQNNNNGNQTEASATNETDNDAFNDIFNQIFAQSNGWLQANGFKGAGNVDALRRGLGMVGNWKKDDQAMRAVGQYAQFFADLTGSSSATYKAGYKQKKGGLAGVGQDIEKDAAKIKKVIDDVAHDIDKIAEKFGHLIADGALTPLIPLKPGMKAAIKSAKYADANPPSDTLNLAKEFVKKVILNEQLESLENFARMRAAAPKLHAAVAARAPAAPVYVKRAPIQPKKGPAPGPIAPNRNFGPALNSPPVNVNVSPAAAVKNDLHNQAAASPSGIPPGWTADTWAAYQALLQREQDGAGSGSGGGGSDGGGDDSGQPDFGDGYPDDGYAGSDIFNTDSGDDDFSDIVYEDGSDDPDFDNSGDLSEDDTIIFSDEEPNDISALESLEKKAKYGLYMGADGEGYETKEEYEYLTGAGIPEKKLWHKYKRHHRELAKFESLLRLESLSQDEATGAAIGGAAGSVVPGVGNVVGAAAGSLVGMIIDWFKGAHKHSSSGNATPSEQAANQATQQTLSGMTQAQKDIAMGINPFIGWFDTVNDDGSVSLNWKHVVESTLGAAAVVLIFFALID